MPDAPLRIVAYCVMPIAYARVREWVERNGHRLVLLVTTPGPPARRSVTYRDVVAMAPPEQEILITTRPRRSSAQVALTRPDVVLSFTFPYRLPPEVLELPRLGAVNLHPAPLPAYRGPNPLRQMYDGAATLGSTLHRTDAEFDTGPILSRHELPMPEDASLQNILGVWGRTMDAALEEGLARLIAGEPGEPQDDAHATYGAAFTEEDRWLDWSLPARLLQCRTAPLVMTFGGARATIDGHLYTIHRLIRTGRPASAAPGTVLARDGESITLCAADAVVQVTATPDEATG